MRLLQGLPGPDASQGKVRWWGATLEFSKERSPPGGKDWVRIVSLTDIQGFLESWSTHGARKQATAPGDPALPALWGPQQVIYLP